MIAAGARYVLIPALLAGALLVSTGARAGDLAKLEVIGFGPDGDFFAFEEYGVQDGSGFPYSNIYVVDTATDSWLPDTPVRVRIEQEDTVEEARAQARRQATPILRDNGIDEPAVALAASPIGEFDSDPANLTFGQRFPTYPLKAPPRRFTATLDIYDAEAPAWDCQTFIDGKPKGFRLKIRNLDSNAETVLHEDTGDLPASRGCPITYRLTEIDVQDLYPAGKVAVIVSVFKPGFEGPDQRYLAVTGALPE